MFILNMTIYSRKSGGNCDPRHNSSSLGNGLVGSRCVSDELWTLTPILENRIKITIERAHHYLIVVVIFVSSHCNDSGSRNILHGLRLLLLNRTLAVEMCFGHVNATVKHKEYRFTCTHILLSRHFRMHLLPLPPL